MCTQGSLAQMGCWKKHTFFISTQIGCTQNELIFFWRKMGNSHKYTTARVHKNGIAGDGYNQVRHKFTTKLFNNNIIV